VAAMTLLGADRSEQRRFLMVADHRPARASAIVAATNAFFAFL
jgi:hypothetical protein